MVADAGRSEESDMRKRLTVKSAKTNPPIPPFAKGGVGGITKLSLRADRSSPKHYTAKDEQGFALVVALLALLVITVIGVLALSTSITEVMVAGNTRLREINFSSADAGISTSEPVMRNPSTSSYAFIDLNLRNEIFCSSQMNPDTQNFSIVIGGNNVNVDIDYATAGDPGPGYSMEEGGPPILEKNYIINSTSTGNLGSEGVVGAVYFIVGYCD